MDKGEAESLLHRWGQWSRSHSGLDFSSLSIIGRMIEQGPGAGHAGTGQTISMPDDIAHCEKIICRMSKSIRKTLVSKYVFGLSQKELAKYYHCDRNEIRRRIDNGVMFLAGAIAFAD